ncbi:desmoplakin-like [Hydractinia symbiolongicarpus]|uniref:desmoplakin-like n=1 Tax=Hydractinia symbiolongicarpus TaxID=13093 RepID=UPI00254C2F4F|nr:desmoplakin-like [Hydractinia symbiolongicarpus]
MEHILDSKLMIAKLVDEKKEQFLSYKYYKYKFEESSLCNAKMINELKLMQRMLNERKATYAEQNQRLVYRYESAFDIMKTEVCKKDSKIALLKAELDKSLMKENELGKIIKMQTEIVKTCDNYRTKLKEAKERELRSKQELLECQTKHAVDVQKYESVIQTLNRKDKDLTKETQEKDSKIYLIETRLEDALIREAELKNRIEEQSIFAKAENELKTKLKRAEEKELQRKQEVLEYQTKHAADVDKYESVIQTLKMDCEELRKKVEESDRLKDEILTLRSKLDISDQLYDDEKSKNEFEIQELKIFNEEKIGDMMRIKDEKIMRQTTYVENFREECKELQEKLEDKTKMVKMLYKQVKDIDLIAQAGITWKSKYDDLVKERNNMQEELQRFKKQSKLMEKKVPDKTNENSGDEKLVEKLQSELKEIQNKKKKLQDEVNKEKIVVIECEELKKKNIEMASILKDKEEVIVDLKLKLTNQEKDLFTLEAEYKSADEKIKQFEELCKRYEQCSATENDVDQTKSVYSDVFVEEREKEHGNDNYASDCFEEDASEMDKNNNFSFFLEDAISEDEGEVCDESVIEEISEVCDDVENFEVDDVIPAVAGGVAKNEVEENKNDVKTVEIGENLRIVEDVQKPSKNWSRKNQPESVVKITAADVFGSGAFIEDDDLDVAIDDILGAL